MKIMDILHIMFDKRLYGRGIVIHSLPSLALAFIINALILSTSNAQLFLPLYAIIFISFVIFAALPAKNHKREFYAIGYWESMLFLMAGVLAETYVLVGYLRGAFGYNTVGLFAFGLLFSISTIALTIAVLYVTVLGQRVSLRESVGLVDDFFGKQKMIWESDLSGFSNVDKIIKHLDYGMFIPKLFDKGLFNLTVLWSCNMMEKIIDAVVHEIIVLNPEKRDLFRTKERWLSYPRKLKNLGYKYSAEDKLFDFPDLWNKLRNKIAHHNSRPTFDETYEALKILVSFTNEMPKIIKTWLKITSS